MKNLQEHISHTIDLSYLDIAAGGNKANIIKYIEIFIRNLPKRVAALHAALEREDPELLYAALHTLKSELKFMGIINLFTASEKLEMQVRELGVVNAEIREHVYSILSGLQPAVADLEKIKIHYRQL